MGPVLPLGAVFLAGNSQKGRQFTGGEGGKQFLAGGFAAGSAEYVVNEALNAAGIDQSQVPDELGQAALGAALSRYGGAIPQNKAMARGIHYNVATQSIQNLGLTLEDIVGGSLGGGSGVNTASAPSPSQVNSPAPQTNRSGSNMVSY